jgi:phospholipid transport system transporter-binding protein
VAALKGELSFESVPALLARAKDFIADQKLDLSGVSTADSAGVALLLELTRRAQLEGRQLVLSGAPRQLRDLIQFFDLQAALKLDGAS